MKIFLTICIVLLSYTNILFAQGYPIYIDGVFNDWNNVTDIYIDTNSDGNDIDFVSLSASNNNTHLFIKLLSNDFFNLTDQNDVFLYIDSDDNPNTGYEINGIGAELSLDLASGDGYFYTDNDAEWIELYDIDFINLPTVSSDAQEIAIRRNTYPNGTHPLFTSNTIKITFVDWEFGGDDIPNNGDFFSYTFDNTDIVYPEPISLEKEQTEHIRLMTYNVLADGIIDNIRAPIITRIVAATQPDIITFNECWDALASEAKGFLDNAIPLNNDYGWYTVKLVDGNITASRFPFIEHWDVLPGRRLTASLIDLPNNYASDFLVINAHLKCCNDDDLRQYEADGFVKFIRDAKVPGGNISLNENTPFVFSGDMNLVGDIQPLTTMLTGQIVNTGVFGSGGPLDWNDSNLVDIISTHTDSPMAYTWSGNGGPYPPGRLDFHICSGSVMEVKKAYTLRTEVMPFDRLLLYGLEANDSNWASDHLPKVSDFSLDMHTDTSFANPADIFLLAKPNPFNNTLNLQFQFGDTASSLPIDILVYNAIGQLVWQQQYTNNNPVTINTQNFTKGLYFIKASQGETCILQKVVK